MHSFYHTSVCCRHTDLAFLSCLSVSLSVRQSVCLFSVTELCWNSCASCQTLFSLSGWSIFLVFFEPSCCKIPRMTPSRGGGIKFRGQKTIFFSAENYYLSQKRYMIPWMFILYYGAVIGRCRYLLNDVTFDDIEWPWKAGYEAQFFQLLSARMLLPFDQQW